MLSSMVLYHQNYQDNDSSDHHINEDLDGNDDVLVPAVNDDLEKNDDSDMQGDHEPEVKDLHIPDDLFGTRGMVPWPDTDVQWVKHIIDPDIYHPHNVILTDIDQDGDLDAAATIRDGATVVWYEAPDDPTEVWTMYEIDDNTSVVKPDSLWYEDIDEDGDTDLLATDAPGNENFWYECPADPTVDSWLKHVIDNNISNPHCIITGDIDQDGDPDAVGTGLDGSVIRWYEAPSDPTDPWTIYDIHDNLSGPHDLRIVDLDDDGDLDVVMGDHGGGNVYWYECPADPTLVPGDMYTVGSSINTRGVYVEDIDEDGNPDVLACSNAWDSVIWFEAPDDPTGTWTDHVIDSTLGRAVYIWADDIDEEGNPDIMATGEDDEVKWYEAPDDAVNGTWTEHVIDDDLDRAYYVVSGDIDEDGDPDIAVAGHDENEIVWYESNSHNYNGSDVAFGSEVINTTYDSHCVAVYDMDDDGDPDVVHTDYYVDAVLWSEAPDDPTEDWETHLIASTLDYAFDVAVEDIDEDGNPDVVATGTFDDEVIWYKAPDDPTDSWTGYQIDTSLDGARGICTADMDEDGDPDVVAAGFNDNDIIWYEAPDDPTGSWTKHTIDGSFTEADDVFVSDIDEDGSPDVVAVGFGDEVAWYESGSWTKNTIDSSIENPTDVVVQDMDEDGDPDVVIAGYNSAGENIVIYLAPDDPTGSWTQVTVEDSLNMPMGVDVGDINEDGRYDIVSIGLTSDDVKWYEAPDDPTDTWFSRMIEDDYNATDVKLADIDEDGDLDVVIGSSTTTTDVGVRWYNNEMILINEIMFNPNGTDDGEEWLELYNPTGPVHLEDWIIESGDASVIATLPDQYLPFDCYLIVQIGSGTDDFDFSDNIGHYYTGATTAILDNTEDGVGLFAPISGKPLDADNTTIIDFVQWDDDDTYSGSTTVHDVAVSGAALWTNGDYVNLTTYVVSDGESIGRDNMSLDTNSSTDWEDHGGVDATTDTPGLRNLDANASEEDDEEEWDPDDLEEVDPSILGDYFLYVTNEGYIGGGETIIQIDSNGSAAVVGTGFNGPSGLALNETSTDLFVSDDDSAAYIVRTNGSVETILADGELDNPNALAFDAEGRLLIAEAGQGSIYRANLSTDYVEIMAQWFSVPQAVAFYDGDVYFTDDSGWVYIIHEDDELPVESPVDARFSDSAVAPSTKGGLVIDSNGTIYLSHYSEGSVIKVNQDGSSEEIVNFSGILTRGLALHPENESLLFVTGYDSDQIFMIDLTDNTPYLFADDVTTGNNLWGPFGMVITEYDYDEFDPDGVDEEIEEVDPLDLDEVDPSIIEDYFLYVTNEGRGGGGETIIQIDANGSAVEIGDGFNGPSGLAVNETSTDLFVSDDNAAVYDVELGGTLTTILDSVGLGNPNALAFDEYGRLLIADAGDSVYRADLSTMTLEHLADNCGIPQAVAYYDGDVYFTDSSGWVYCIEPGASLPVDPSTVRFSDDAVVPNTSGGMVIDEADGTIYVADYEEGRVVRVWQNGSSEIVIDFSDFYARGLAFHPDNSSLLFVTGYNTDQIILVDLTDSNAYEFANDSTTGDLLFGPFGMIITEYEYTAFSLADVEEEEEGETYHVGKGKGFFKNIQGALRAVKDGDTIWIHPGDYSGTIKITKNITLRSDDEGFNLSASILVQKNAHLQIVDCLIYFDPDINYQHHIRVNSQADGLTISGSTLSRAGSMYWGRIIIEAGPSLIIEDSIIEYGKYVAFRNTDVVLRNATFENLRGGVVGYPSGMVKPIIENLVITGCNYGLWSYDTVDWNITGDDTDITGNHNDIVVASSGSIFISSLMYDKSLVLSTATGEVIHPTEEEDYLYVGNEDGDFISIRKALKRAVDGDTIWVREGEYTDYLKITKDITLMTDEAGIDLSGHLNIVNGGQLSIIKAVIRFNCTTSYQYSIFARDTARGIVIKNSSITRSGSSYWGKLWIADGVNLTIEDSEITYGKYVVFSTTNVILRNATFKNLIGGVSGNPSGAAAPVFDNLVITGCNYGLWSYDTVDWNITGEKTNISGNGKDIMIGSSGNVYISSNCYDSYRIRIGATGRVLEP